MASITTKEPSSFRDPSGYIFSYNNNIYRQVNSVFKDHFDYFISSGCYKSLTDKGLLIPHQEVKENFTGDNVWYTTLQPEEISFISYPYEWSFDMLKDAALLTLRLTKESIASGCILKDATPFNIQWHKGKFIFIDSLSFERYDEKIPWIAYRQFCENFLSPLLLMHYTKASLHQLVLAYPNGIPISITKSLLPKKSRFSFLVYLHIYLQASFENKKSSESKKPIQFSKKKMLNLLSSLEALISKLKTPNQKTTWSAYYEEASLRNDYLDVKKEMVKSFINDLAAISNAVDIGANDGEFSKLLASKNIETISVDFDANCINNLYLNIKSTNESAIQPLIIDISNPSPSIGVNNEERSSFLSRANAELVIALAVIHHLAIGKNIPFEKIAVMFKKIVKTYLVIEFVPKADEKVQLMLKEKADIYTDYTIERFEMIFSQYFNLMNKKEINNSGRVLYTFKRND